MTSKERMLTPKERLLDSLTTMPDEAFGWIVQALARQQIFPDGLGGFRVESRKAIVEFQAALVVCAVGE